MRHFYPDMGSNWGYSGFSCNQNNCSSSGVYSHLHLLRSDHEHKCVNGRLAHEDRGGICFAFLRVWSAKT